MTQSNDGRSSRITRSTPSFGEGVLVARLRGGEQEERIDSLVANERLGEPRRALNDVNEVEDHSPLRPHDEIEIAQAHVEIDDGDSLAAARQSRTKRGGRCRLADAPFPDVTTTTWAI